MFIRHKKIKPSTIIKRKEFNLREFYEKRNSVLILRSIGGLGDILMHRMMFEDFKKIMPDSILCFACPKRYHDAVYDHPFIDELLDSDIVNPSDYILNYNTSSACCRHELSKAPFSGDHRSDIWANHCGVKLTNHNMHINLQEEIKEEGKSEVERYRNNQGPAVLFTPISAMGVKNLTSQQIKIIVEHLRKRGCYVYSSHTQPIPELVNLNVPILIGSIKKWMGFVNAADYVVSVDTAALHMGGGLGKPMVGIFGCTDGKVYTKFYKCELIQKHRDNKDWDCGPCFNWANCIKSKISPKPCILEINLKMIINGIDKMLNNY